MAPTLPRRESSALGAKMIIHRGSYDDCRLVLGAGEAVFELAAQSNTPRALVASSPKSCTILGYYQSYNRFCREEGEGRCVRRITGGATISLPEEWNYLALAVPGLNRLSEAVELANRLTTCLYGSQGPVIASRKGIGVLGVTILGGTGFIEVMHSAQPDSLTGCLSREGFTPLQAQSLPGGLARARSNRYYSSTWNKYSFREEMLWAKRCRGGYWIRIGLETFEGYIAGWSVEGLFYSSPPPEIYSVLASVKGTPFHELVRESLKEALSSRLEVAGITLSDILSAIEELHEKSGVKHYTA